MAGCAATSVMAASMCASASLARASSTGKGPCKIRMGRVQRLALRTRAVRSVRMMASRDPDAAPFIPEINGYGQNVEEGQTIAPRELTPDEQDRVDSGVGSLGLDVDGPGTGGQWISSTTRHVHIFAGVINNGDLDQSQLDKLTIDVDPDMEFNWTDGALQQVFDKFDSLVGDHAGAPLNDYTLRLIGSDCEHFIRKLLQKGEISYNLEHRALNYSMGRPRLALEGVEEEMGAASSPAELEASPVTESTSA